MDGNRYINEGNEKKYYLTHTKRVTLAFLIMASFTFAIANIHFADAQRIEFIVQFGTSQFDVATDLFADSLSGDVYVVGYTYGTLHNQQSEGDTDAFLAKLVDDDKKKRK